MQKSRLVILEGPAASGKSTAAKALLEHYPDQLHLVQKSIVIGDQREKLEDPELDWMSWINDIDKTMAAIGQMYERPVTVLVDRLALSQVVYGHLRIASLPGHGAGSTALRSWYELYLQLWRDLTLRDYSSLPLSVPEFRILYFNPGVDVLKERRGDNRGYTFHAGDEVLAYESVVKDIMTPVFRFEKLGVNDVESVLFR